MNGPAGDVVTMQPRQTRPTVCRHEPEPEDRGQRGTSSTVTDPPAAGVVGQPKLLVASCGPQVAAVT